MKVLLKISVCTVLIIFPNKLVSFIIPKSSCQTSSRLALSLNPLIKNNGEDKTMQKSSNHDILEKTPLSMSIDQLGNKINGKGRALTTWDCYKVGLDPLYFFSDSDNKTANISNEVWDHHVYDVIRQSSFNNGEMKFDSKEKIIINDQDNNLDNYNYRERLVRKYMPMKRIDIHNKQEGKGMGTKALSQLSNLYPNPLGIEYSIASLVNLQRSSDGTVKMLLKLNTHNKRLNSNSHGEEDLESQKDYYIESVIIPWYDRSNPTSTLCVSTQVGCAQGCTFCATGKMGLMKRLSSDEILIQLYYAKKICRILNDRREFLTDIHYKNNEWLPEIDNIVFMGMGDSGDNANSVIEACSIMADRQCFAIPQNKITISTVGPFPEVFSILGQADAVLAWSVHAVNDDLRKQLVPTTKYRMDELKEGLIKSLITRSKRMRAVMIEVTLIEDVNDSIKEAKEMVEFCLEIKRRVQGMKLVVNLIPFNEISHGSYKKSPRNNVVAYQQELVDNGVMSYIRTTRGDDENAACGQLATKRLSRNNNNQ